MSEQYDPSDLPSMNLEHWLCTHFEHHLRLQAPETVGELETVIRHILMEYECSCGESIPPYLLDMVREAPDCLRALRRWLASAARHRTKDGLVSLDNIERGAVGDLQTIFVRLRYCGFALDVPTFERWSEQFGELQSVAAHLVQRIARDYFINDREYFNAIDSLIKSSGIPRRSNVVFCKWQSEGQSGPKVANQVKNRANWRVDTGVEIDLTRDDAYWPELEANANHQLVLVDDFVGSGRTISKLFVGDTAPIPRLLERLPHARMWIGIIVGYEAALSDALGMIEKYASRVTITPYKLLTEQDKCFSDTSRIFTGPVRNIVSAISIR
jgi:hypothetical protein